VRRTCAVLLLGIAVAFGATACGGSSSTSTSNSTTSTLALTPKTIYEQKMQVLNQELDSVLSAVAGANNSQTSSGQSLPPKTEAANLQIAQTEMTRAAVKLAKIVPPDNVKAAHALLLKGLREDAVELQTVIDKLKHGASPLTVLPTLLKMKGLKEMQAASATIAKAGYDILGTGSTGG